MRSRSSWILLLLASCILPLGSALAAEETPTSTNTSAKADTEITLKSPTWQAVLDKLFGTPDSGLLDGTKSFQIRAEDVTLTSSQSADFFTSATSLQNLTDLIKGAEALHGVVRMEGTIDGQPFELKIAGRELKIEGLTLTAEQREALATQLSSISGLHEAKIEARVDGQRTVTKIEGDHHVKVEMLDRDREKQGRSDHARIEAKERLEHPHVEIEHSVNAELHDRIEHGGGILEKLERPGKH